MDIIYRCAQNFIKMCKVRLCYRKHACRSNNCIYFLKKRDHDEMSYCINSFFPKGEIVYGGMALYWMLKKKVIDDVEYVIYKHPNYECI